MVSKLVLGLGVALLVAGVVVMLMRVQQVHRTAQASPLADTAIVRASVGVAPRIINFQGILTTSSGAALPDGPKTFVFSLYATQVGGSPLWSETQQVVTRRGYFTALLETKTPLAMALVTVPELWLGIQVLPDPQMKPRQRVTSSVYALGAVEAQVSNTVGVSAQQIALRQWYQANRVRGPRTDLAFVADDSGVPGTSIYAEVTALTTNQVGTVTYSYGNWVGVTAGPVENRGQIGNNIGESCYVLRPLGHYIICAHPSELIIMPQSTGANSPPPQKVPCHNCRGIAFDGTNIWVSSAGTDTNAVLKISLGRDYEEDLIGPAFATHPNPNPPSIIGSYSTGKNPRGVEFDGKHIWVANEGDATVTVLMASDGSVVKTISVGTQPRDVLFDGSDIWVLNSGSESVTKIRFGDQAIIGTFKVGKLPEAISFDGASIWVANAGDNSITRLRNTDGSAIETIELPGSPHFLQFDGIGSWVATRENLPAMKAKIQVVQGERWILTRY